MKVALGLLLWGLCALSTIDSAAVDANYAQRQRDITRLFSHINQPSYYKDHVQIVKSFNIQQNIGQYNNPEVVQNFLQYIESGTLLQRGQIFSVFNEHHLEQAIALFKLFYYANTYEIFYNTSVYARNRVNEGIFLYSFSVALLHRPDTYNFVLPPIYEVYPHYFYSSDVIQQAQNYRQIYAGQRYQTHQEFQEEQQGTGHHEHHHERIRQQDGQQVFTVYANYTGQYLNLNPEQSVLSYFTEDVGVNAFYYYYNLYYPSWLNGTEFNLKNDQRGEVFFAITQQILARYNLERLSNGFGEVEWFNWEIPFKTGYYPQLRYPNGLEFPSRPNFANLYEYFYNYGQKWQFTSRYGHSYTLIQNYESRIRTVIDSGFVLSQEGKFVSIFTPDGINALGNLVEGNADSPYRQYYGAYQVFARHLLGYSFQPNNFTQVYPSALEHFETSLRDPAFYQLYKKLLTFYVRYLYNNPNIRPYTTHDLEFKGVAVKNVQFDRLVTYFDSFTADLSNAIYVSPEESVRNSFRVQVVQQRLNHRPFSYKIQLESYDAVDAVVRVYLGPKYDSYGRYATLSQNWLNFVQFDHFTTKLQPGENLITRNYNQIVNYIHDRTSYLELYQQAFSVYDKQSQFQFNKDQILYGFPHGLLLPKGSPGGTTFQVYVIVSPVKPYQTHDVATVVGSGRQYVDGYPFYYPFDRPIEFEQVFRNISNSYFEDVTVYHKEQIYDINATPVHL